MQKKQEASRKGTERGRNRDDRRQATDDRRRDDHKWDDRKREGHKRSGREQGDYRRDDRKWNGRPQDERRGDDRKRYDRDARPAEPRENRELPENLIPGRNPVLEALKTGRQIEKILVQDGATGSIGKIIATAKAGGVRIDFVDKKKLDLMAGGTPHQGIIAVVPGFDYAEVDDVLAKSEEEGRLPIIVLLDDIEDPHNLGAIMRTAECVGAAGVIIPKRGSSGLSPAAVKAAAGAAEYLPCARVTNLVRTIEELKERGYWICCCDMDGQPYDRCDLQGKLAIVIGSEGKGVSRLIKEKCDFVVGLPLRGRINSLNASNAAAIVLYEALRQRNSTQG